MKEYRRELRRRLRTNLEILFHDRLNDAVSNGIRDLLTSLRGQIGEMVNEQIDTVSRLFNQTGGATDAASGSVGSISEGTIDIPPDGEIATSSHLASSYDHERMALPTPIDLQDTGIDLSSMPLDLNWSIFPQKLSHGTSDPMIPPEIDISSHTGPATMPDDSSSVPREREEAQIFVDARLEFQSERDAAESVGISDYHQNSLLPRPYFDSTGNRIGARYDGLSQGEAIRHVESPRRIWDIDLFLEDNLQDAGWR